MNSIKTKVMKNKKDQEDVKYQIKSVDARSNDGYKNDYSNYNGSDYWQRDRSNSTRSESNGKHYHFNYNYKKLYKSTRDKWLGGVCGGIAEYYNKDPVTIRVLWVLLTIISVGVGILAYVLLWYLLDKYPSGYPLYDQYGRRIHYHYHY